MNNLRILEKDDMMIVFDALSYDPVYTNNFDVMFAQMIEDVKNRCMMVASCFRFQIRNFYKVFFLFFSFGASVLYYYQMQFWSNESYH
jgi:hypothetical protein